MKWGVIILATKTKANKADLIDKKPTQTGRGQINNFNTLEKKILS